MGCTSSKENTNPPPTTITDHNQQLINEQFRQWLRCNRPKADEYVLNHIISTAEPSSNIDDYRPIVSKALDLLSERSDIKSINKLNKLVQKEVSLASPKKVSRTIDILKQTAEKIRHESIIFDHDQPQTTNGEVPKTSEKKHSQMSSGEPGIALKEALEKARILFYKGKQAAIFANTNGGYDVRIIDDNDDVLKQDGNLLRSIIVTEVTMRPKPPPPTTTLPQFIAPPPPSPKVLDEREIGDDFRRSIDAALKGLEAIYHPSPVNPVDIIHEKKVKGISETDMEPHERIFDTSGNPISSNEDKKHGEHLSTHQSSSSQQKVKLPIPEGIYQNSSASTNKTEEGYNKTLSESSLTPVNTHTTPKSPSHNVTYTEIIQSESHDGEQSRRFITESYDELPTKDDEQTTTLKVLTKSEFSNHPLIGEKIMEQSVQILTVKVRNETVTTTTSPRTSDHEISYEKPSLKTDATI